MLIKKNKKKKFTKMKKNFSIVYKLITNKIQEMTKMMKQDQYH